MKIGIEATRIPSTPSAQGSRNPVSGVTGLLTSGVGGVVNRERDSGAVEKARMIVNRTDGK